MNTNSPSPLPSATRHRPKTVSRWQAVVTDFASSGLAVGEFCRARGVCEQSFYAWRKRLAQGDALSAGPSFFVPVVVEGRGVGGCIELDVQPAATPPADAEHAVNSPTPVNFDLMYLRYLSSPA